MIDVNYLKRYMGINDTSQDDFINDTIKRNQLLIKGMCKNNDINFNDTSDLENNPLDEDLDPVLLHYCIIDINLDTRFNAGKKSENAGASFNYNDELPKHLKKVLRKYRRIGIKQPKHNNGGLFE